MGAQELPCHSDELLDVSEKLEARFSDEVETHLLTGKPILRRRNRPHSSSLSTRVYIFFNSLSKPDLHQPTHKSRFYIQNVRRLKLLLKYLILLACVVVLGAATIVLVTGLLFPSYAHPPKHYSALRRRIRWSDELGRGNPTGQKIFIASSIYDGDGQLVRGRWGEALLELIDLLGPQNVFLSIYENGEGGVGQVALNELEERVSCNHSLTYDRSLKYSQFPHVRLSDGSRRLERITYLSEVRNKPLLPLHESSIVFDKLLYVNDVYFSPIDIVQLLFSTNAAATGRENYRAACAVDYEDPFKFYDEFATRDAGGFEIAPLPLFPWFSPKGDIRTYNKVVQESDAVPVRSCWGGIAAFDASFFQTGPNIVRHETAGQLSPLNVSGPYRFRAAHELYWDASECCLIHADIQSPDPTDRGIYINPYVRVAYHPDLLFWINLVRRCERLMRIISFFGNAIYDPPHGNPRRAQQPWDHVVQRVWVADESTSIGGSFDNVTRLASHDGFCGQRRLEVIRENRQPGERNWEFIDVPPLWD